MRSVIVNDINYLCIKLEAETQMSAKEILIKVKQRHYCDSTKKSVYISIVLLRTPRAFI